MAAPSLTYTLTNGSTADASQVMQNYNDLLNGITDGTKDLSINALTLAGALTANGNVTVGNASGDELTVNASLASSIPVKTTASYNVGDSTHGLAGIYFGANSQTVRVVPSGSMSATWTLTLPVTAGTNNYILTTNGSGVSAWTAWTNSAWYADGSNAGTLSATTQTIGGDKTFSGTGTFTQAATNTFSVVTTGTTTDSSLLLDAGSGTTSSRTSYITFRANETTAHRWDFGMFGSKEWIMKQVSPTSVTALLISSTNQAVTMRGTDTNDNALAGFYGEFATEISVSTATNFTSSGALKQLGSMALTKGDWDVAATVTVIKNGATMSGVCEMLIGATSASSSGTTDGKDYIVFEPPGTGTQATAAIPLKRISIASDTTYYLNGAATYSAGTPQYRCYMAARRVR